MSRNFGPFVFFLIMATAGCASTGQVNKIEETSETNQKLLRETEHRLSSLETSVSALNGQLANLNNRVYEVRTSNGKKTAMKVVPVVGGSSDNAVAANADNGSGRQIFVRKSAGNSGSTQGARIIDPSAKPTPLPVQGQSGKQTKNRIKKQNDAGPTGSIGSNSSVSGGVATQAHASDGLDLPPTELPGTANAGSPGGQSAQGYQASPDTRATNNEIPVPSLNDSEVGLPPEHPDIAAPAVHGQVADRNGNAPQPVAQPSQKQVTQTRSRKGEEASYKEALNLVLSGKTSQGIAKFRNFLQEYPNGKYTANADFWIGECLYSQGKYKEALDQFQIVNSEFPNHHKNADALLKAGMSLSRMGDKAAAAEKFRLLLNSFPNSDAAKRARTMGAGR